MGNSPFSKVDVFFLKRIVEILGNAGVRWQRLLNALQTAGAADAPQDKTNSALASGTGSVGRALAWHHAEGAGRPMRPGKSLFNALLTHFLMGVALGLSLVLLLGLTDAFHVRDLVAKSAAPVQTTLMLVTTYGLMFGIGAALTGLVLTLEDES
jgi:hypothetical protein